MFGTGKKIIATTLIVVMIITIAMPTSANMGGYLNNVMTQLKGLAPKAYEGQERGYFVGGSASIRWGFDNQPLVSFTPPSIKVGCSGIDIVMGGFSYLNFEYLVQKLQAILSAAPAFAFKVAIKTLCEACDNVLTALEDIANMINQLNVDSCQAAKAVGAFAGKAFADAVGHQSSSGQSDSWFTAQTRTLKQTTDKWKNFIKDYAGMYDCAAYAQGSEAAKKCLQQVGKVSFFAPLMAQAFSKANISTNFPFENIFRAKFGDFYQDKNENNADSVPKIIRDPGCYDRANPAPRIIDAMVYGQYKVKNNPAPENQGCQDINDPQQGLKHKVEQVLKSMVQKIRSGSQQLSQDEINLVNAARVPIYRILSLAVLVERIGGDTNNLLTENFVEKFATPIAYDIAWSVTAAIIPQIGNLVDAARAEKQMGLDENINLSMNTMIQNINAELVASDEQTQKAWQALRDQLGDLAQKEIRMKNFIFQELAKNRLLDSYIFAKGLR